MIKPQTDATVIAAEIEALENAINNPRDRDDYLSDFFSNADLLLRAMKSLQRGEVKVAKRIA